MDVPITRLQRSGSSIFQEILEEYSSLELAFQSRAPYPQTEQCEKCNLETQDRIESQLIWLSIHDDPEDLLIKDDRTQEESYATVEITKLQILREEQENKLQQLISMRPIAQCRGKKEDFYDISPFSPCKTSKSLSPKKTKRIDKKKSFKLLQEEE